MYHNIPFSANHIVQIIDLSQNVKTYNVMSNVDSKLSNETTKTKTRQQFFGKKVVNEWNRLYETTVMIFYILP